MYVFPLSRDQSQSNWHCVKTHGLMKYKMISAVRKVYSKYKKMTLRSRLAQCPSDIPKFNFAGQSFYSRLYECYDGDSIKILIEMSGKWYHISCRLLGIDTPELNTKNAVEKAKAIRAKRCVLDWALPGKFASDVFPTKKELKTALANECVIIFVKCHEQEKFGRTLIEVYKNENDKVSLNQILKDEGFACAYDGGTKITDWSKA